MPQIFETKHKLPFGIFSSSVNTGYNAEISSSFQPGVDITNLHGDNYASFENSPAQGPFTEAHVGGNQHRHIPLNTGTQSADTRPEAFLIDFQTAGELRIFGPDLVDTARPRASMLRGNAAKRPLNIENLRSSTGSALLGNFTRDYEIVQTSGRRINNRFLTKTGDIPVTASNSVYVTGLVGYDLPDRENTGSNKFIFVERFNAPGGPDVSSRGVLDIEAEEMAPNNALPFRNLNVKLPLRSFLTQHAGQFGYSSLPEHTASAFTTEASASFHKVNRNTLFRPEEDVSLGNITCLELQFSLPIGFIGEQAEVGRSVDTSGSLSVAGAPGTYAGGDVLIARSGSSGWAQEDTVTGSVIADRFGDSVSVDRDYLIVGAPGSGSGGSVSIFRSGSSGWIQEQTLNGPSASSEFGNDVDKYSSLLVVGASGSISGSAFIYRSGSSGWALEVELTGAYAGAGFGSGVVLEDNFVVVGAPGTGSDVGTLDLFESGSSGWSLLDTVTGLATEDEGIGYSVKMQGGTVVAGVRGTLSTSVGPRFYKRSSVLTRQYAEPVGEVLTSSSVGVYGCLALVSAPNNVFVYAEENDGLDIRWKQVREISIGSIGSIGKVALDDNTIIFGNPGSQGFASIYDYCVEKRSCVAVYDNWFVQHLVPRSDLRYSWITASALTKECELFGYQRDGRNENRAQAFTDIEFVGAHKRDNTPGGFGVSVEVLGDFLGITGSDNGIKSSSVDVDSHEWNNSILELRVNNGAYQYPVWKQLRTGEHPLARALRAQNIIAVQDEPKSIILDTTTGKRRVFRARFSDSFRNFVEPPITSRYRPIEHQLMFKGSVNPLLAHEIKHTYGNNLGMFANKELDNRVGILKDEEQAYDKIFEFYADQDLPEDENPVARFLGLTYRELIHPREENTYLAITRGRTEYAEVEGSGSNGQDRIFGQQRTFWKDDISEARDECASNSQDFRLVSEIILPEGELFNPIFTQMSWDYSVVDRGNDGNNTRMAVVQTDNLSANYGLIIYQLQGKCEWVIEDEFNDFTIFVPSFSGSYIAADVSSPNSVAVYRSGSTGFVVEDNISGNSGPTFGPIAQFTRHPSIHSNKLAIGYPGIDDPLLNAGGIEIWGSSSAGWQIEFELSGTAGNQDFGESIQLFENTVVIGAPGFDSNGLVNNGAVFIYESSSAGGWEFSQRIDGQNASEQFGDGVDYDGQHIIAWNAFADVNGFTNNGVLRVYRKIESGVWVQDFEVAGEYDEARVGASNLSRGAAIWNGMFAVTKNFTSTFPQTYFVDIYTRVENGDWRKTATIEREPSGSSNRMNLSSLNNKLIGLGDDFRELDDALGNGNIYPVLRQPWGINSTNFDEINYDSRAFSPLRTDGVRSFPESGSYSALNGELSTDSDASMFVGQPLPSLCFVEAASNFLTPPLTGSTPVSGTSTDYVERLTEEISGLNPWFDTYEEYAEDIRRTGKDCAIVPEFKTSEHMEHYVIDNNGNFRVDNRRIFSLPGATITSSAESEDVTGYDVDFQKKYLSSDRLRYFDDIKKEHEDIAAPSRITLRCKGLKKLLPYNGFYPQNRTVQIGGLLSQSVGDFITGFSGSDENNAFSAYGLQALLKPLVSPGILFNSIKGGIAVDYPVYTASAPATRETGSTTSEFVLQDAPNYRLPFETLVGLTEHLPKESPIRLISTFTTDEDTSLEFPYYFKWNGDKGALYELAMHNFLAEVPNFFLAEGTLNNFASAPEFKFKEFEADKKYYMDVVLQQNIRNNKFPTYVGTSSLKADEARTLSPKSSPGVADSKRLGNKGVAITDSRLAIGEGSTGNSGSVFIYNNYGLNPWVFEAELTGAVDGLRRLAGIDLSDRELIAARNHFSVTSYLEVFESSSASGWTVFQELKIGTDPGGIAQNTVKLSGSYIAVSAPAAAYGNAMEIWRSGSTAWTFEQAISKSGPGSEFATVVEFGSDISGNLIFIGDPIAAGAFTDEGHVEIHRSGSSGWFLEQTISGTAFQGRLGSTPQGIANSGSYLALANRSDSVGSQEIRFYKSGSSGWALEQVVVPVTGAQNPQFLDFSQENGWLISTSRSPGTTRPGTIQSYRSGSSGWFLETLIDNITGSFDINLVSLGSAATTLSVHKNKFSIAAPNQTINGENNTGAVYTFISESCGWIQLYESLGIGEFNLKQDGRLFGMALPTTGGVVQFNKSLNIYDPAYMAYTPPSFYGEAIARISFTPAVSRKYSLEEIFESAVVENILSQSSGLTSVFVNPTIADTDSLAYQNKMPVSASVTLFGKFSEPNVEFDLTNPDRASLLQRFQPNRATLTENTNKDRWSIGTKFECPVLDVEAYDSQYSASYTTHFGTVENEVFCDIDGLEFQTPRTPWTNYADILPDRRGVFFDVKESFAPDVYNESTGSLLQNCGFTAGRKKVGRLAEQKEISEAIVAIPYVQTAIEGVTVQNASDCNKHFIQIDLETFRTQRENLEKLGIAVKREETSEGRTQKSSTTITDMIQKMGKFVIPPQMDFVKFEDIHPFAMYIFDFSTVLNKRDLINIWHGVMPEPAVRMENDEIIITHEMNEDEFFHGNELPDDIRWMVFKVKQRANQNYFEVTTDASDDNRFRFDFQGDGKVEVVPDLNFNWPYDFFSLVELSKIEVEVQMTNKSELDKLAQIGDVASETGQPGGRGALLGQKRGKKGKGKKFTR